jgi:hypothetical protein
MGEEAEGDYLKTNLLQHSLGKLTARREAFCRNRNTQ